MNYTTEKELRIYKKKNFKFDLKNYHKKALKIIPANGSMLELGIGNGNFISSLKNKFRVLYGADIINENLINTKKRGINKLTKCDLNIKLPFKDKSFDTIIALEVIEHIFEYKHALSEINRILRKDGLFIISVPNCTYWKYQAHLIFKQEIPVEFIGTEGHVVRYSLKQWRNILEKHFKTKTYTTEKIAKLIPLPHNITARYAFFCCRKK